MKIYNKLYARSNTGKVIVWWMEQNKNLYRSCHGQIEGKIVEDNWTKTEPKNVGRSNETSAENQAELEINSKYIKQLKEGYFEKINDIDKELFVQPMLCKNFKDRLDKVKYPVYVSRKYNGMRQVVTKNGTFSRKGEKIISAPHIFESLISLFSIYPDLILDGELYNHDYRFQLNEIISLVRKTVHITEDDLSLSRKKVKYYIYDGYNFLNISNESNFKNRLNGLKDIIRDFKYIELVEHNIAYNEKDVFKVYQDYLDDGYEGCVVRLDAPYENKRSSNCLKLKPEDDDEGTIIDILEGEGNWAQTGKIITLKWKNNIFNATFKGSFEDGVIFLKEKNKWIGKKVTFLYNGLTGLGIPNFARVDYKNCIK